MKRGVKLVVGVVLALLACFFGWQFKRNYSALMAAEEGVKESEVTDLRLPDYQNPERQTERHYDLGFWGAGLVLSLMGLGFVVAHEVSHFLATRAVKTLYDDEGELMVKPDYEKAEEEWGQGNFLEAVRLMRDYLQKHPKEQHVALRIAEIYEKDLHNPLAAALEYEEVLKQKLPAERWGWAAIHLCNLYTSKLNQTDKALALLRRIDTEYGQTAAAEKARARLAQLEAEGIIPPAAPPPPPDEPPPFKLPPGFAPKKS